MIKTLFTLSAALLCTGGTVLAQSQNQAPKNNTLRQVMGTSLTAGKTTATDSRMIATAYRTMQSSNLNLTDSSHCYYSSGFGYDTVLDGWKFDNALFWKYDGSSFTESYRTKHTFNSNSQKNLAHSQENDGTGWQDDMFTTHTYDAAGNEAGRVYASHNGSTWDSSRNTFTYNSANKVTLRLIENFDPGAMQWKNTVRSTTSYNANGQVTVVLSESWNNNQWQNANRTTNTYVNNLVTETVEESWNSSWQNTDKTVYTYNTAGQVTEEEHFSWNSMNSTWDPSRRVTNVYNSAGDVTSITSEIYAPGGYENQHRTLMSYNSYHQMIIGTGETWNPGMGKFEMKNGDNEMRFYYEEYTSSVKDGKTTAGSINVFPNPAKGTLYLRTALAKAEVALVELADMTGRVVRQLQLPAAQQYSTGIDVSALPAGNYIIRMLAGSSIATQKIVIE